MKLKVNIYQKSSGIDEALASTQPSSYSRVSKAKGDERSHNMQEP